MMKLYSYWRSSCSWRVRIALHWKNLEHEIIPVNLIADGGQHRQPAYQSKNPMAQVPTLEVQDHGVKHHIGQSMAILAYLEDRFPEFPLVPDDLYLRGKCRQLAELVNAGIQPLQNLAVLQHLDDLGQDSKEWARHWIQRGLLAFDEISRETRGAHCVGNHVTWADLFLIPQLYNARRFGIDLSGLPALLEIEQRCEAVEAFRRAHPDQQVDAPKPA